MTADKIERQIKMHQIADLKHYERNSRIHTETQLKQIIASIKEFGWTNPVLITENQDIIAGHARVDAATLMGLTEVPCITIAGLTDEQRRALVIADNKLALNAGWDERLLTAELLSLQEVGYDLSITGFDEQEIGTLFAATGQTTGLTDPDEHPGTPKITTSQAGDIWKLGDHRLAVGDSTGSALIERLMNGAKADLVVTDPPYNVNYHGAGKNTSKTIKNDHQDRKAFQELLTDAFKNIAKFSKEGAGIYVFHASRTQIEFETAMTINGFEVKNQLIWNKPTASMGWGDYRWKHEPFFYAGKKGQKIRFYGDRTNTTIWDFQKTEQELLEWARKVKKDEQEGRLTVWTMRRDNVNEYEHPTQKPAALVGRAILNSSKAGDVVMDLFGGSGTTIIAAERTSRACYMAELDELFADVILIRWENFTGQQARHAKTNLTFLETREQRAAAAEKSAPAKTTNE